jgi:putative oxidoreductase
MTWWMADAWVAETDKTIDASAGVQLQDESSMTTPMTSADGADRTQDAVLFAARLGLASLFLFSGTQKLTNLHGAGEWAALQGVPFPQLAMLLAALFEVGAGLMLATGWRARTAASALAAYIIVLAPLFHQFWNAPPQLWQASIDNFFHHLVMFGGMTYLAVFGPGGWRLTFHKG